MIALDTNILARFYVDDPNDPEAAKQRSIAHRLVVDSPRLFVPLTTVILELEWVLRAFYQFSADDFIRIVHHLLGLPNATVEEWSRTPWTSTLRGWTSLMLCTSWPAPIALNSPPSMIATLPAVPTGLGCGLP